MKSGKHTINLSKVLNIIHKDYTNQIDWNGIEDNYYPGLCACAMSSQRENKISEVECVGFINYLYKNKPFTYIFRKIWYNSIDNRRYFFWKLHKTLPRVSWLAKHQKKRKNNPYYTFKV